MHDQDQNARHLYILYIMLATMRKTRIGAFTSLSFRVCKLASRSAVQSKGAPFIVNFVIGVAIAEKS